MIAMTTNSSISVKPRFRRMRRHMTRIPQRLDLEGEGNQTNREYSGARSPARFILPKLAGCYRAPKPIRSSRGMSEVRPCPGSDSVGQSGSPAEAALQTRDPLNAEWL